jgi:hypothetical protein
MKDDLPIEFVTKYDREGRAIKDIPNGKRKTYFVNKKRDKIFYAYNTHAMRSKDALEIKPEFEAYDVEFKERLKLVIKTIIPFKKKKNHYSQSVEMVEVKSKVVVDLTPPKKLTIKEIL